MHKSLTLTLAAVLAISITSCNNNTTPAPEIATPTATPLVEETLSETELYIATDLETKVGIAPTSINCIEPDTITPGTTFDCSVTLDDQTFIVNSTYEADAVNITYIPADEQILLPVETIDNNLTLLAEADLAAGALQIEAETEAVAGACVLPRGDTIYIGKIGDMLECVIANENLTNVLVDVTLEDAEGNITYTYSN